MSVQTVKLLVVEDEPLLAHSLGESLAASGFQPTLAGSSEAAWTAWADAFDLIVLDVMLPEGNEAGLRFARALRKADFTQPVLFLSARETLPDRVRGLEYGDDYLPKPFAPPELVARRRAYASGHQNSGPGPDRSRWRARSCG